MDRPNGAGGHPSWGGHTNVCPGRHEVFAPPLAIYIAPPPFPNPNVNHVYGIRANVVFVHTDG